MSMVPPFIHLAALREQGDTVDPDGKYEVQG